MKSKRFKLLINKKFQLTMLTYTIAVAIVAILCAGFLQSLIMPTDCMPPNLEDLGPLLWVALGIIAVLLTVMTLITIILTNRIAGPIYRLQVHMKSLIRGEPVEDLTIRDSDYFVEVVQGYNELIKKLKKP
jgi:sensor histidine kinase YesM